MSDKKTVKKKKTETTVLSFRVPIEEASMLDAQAKASGLNRNDFIRLCLQKQDAFVDGSSFMEALDTLRQIELLFERYLNVLEESLQLCRKVGKEETVSRIEREIGKAEVLVELSFKAEKQATRILKRIRRKIT